MEKAIDLLVCRRLKLRDRTIGQGGRPLEPPTPTLFRILIDIILDDDIECRLAFRARLVS